MFLFVLSVSFALILISLIYLDNRFLKFLNKNALTLFFVLVPILT